MEYYSVIKKEYIWISSNEVDETGAYYTGGSKPERKTPIQYTNAYSGLISFIIDWFDLLAVQRTLKSLLQHHSSVQSLSLVWLFVTPWITARQASLSITNSCPSSQWCHPAISSSVVPFSSCPQSLPASESFPMSQLLTWGGQSTGVSALASFLPKKSQGWAPLEWTGWISLQSSKVMLNIRQARLQQYVNFQMFKLDLER